MPTERQRAPKRRVEVEDLESALRPDLLARRSRTVARRKRPSAFDLPYDIFGDDGFAKLFSNMSESFSRTCLQLMAEGRPLSDVLTTQRFMMTTALKSLCRAEKTVQTTGARPDNPIGGVRMSRQSGNSAP
jgi:hypothetical protein